MYKREEEMYPHVIFWLKNLLSEKVKRAKIYVYNSSNINLSNLIEKYNYSKYFSSEYLTYDIKVDVTGIIIFEKERKGELALVECKLKPISLKDLSQIIGYSLIVKPFFAIILSPMGISESLYKLLKIYKRTDILKYDTLKQKSIAVAKWIPDRKDVDMSCIIPSYHPMLI